MLSYLCLYTALVLGLLIAEIKETQTAQYILKPAAALGFLGIAISSGALLTIYGYMILAGLFLCAVGDVLLLSRKSQNLFLAGMAAFALGHLAYLTAFMRHQLGFITLDSIAISAAAVACGAGFYIWLRPKLPHEIRLAVGIYTLMILAMVVSALNLLPQAYSHYAMIGAIMFAASDMFVARDRFVTRDPKNALAITPLYFGAQAVIALSTKVSL